MTDQFFFDTDCLAAFLWVREESILEKLYPGKIILPAQVYEEIKKVPHLQARADKMISNGVVQVESMMVDSDEYSDYVQMTSSENSLRIIGNGEAAGIAMVKHRGGTLASNSIISYRLLYFRVCYFECDRVLYWLLGKRNRVCSSYTLG